MVATSMEGWTHPASSECGEKEVGRDAAHRVSAPSFKAGRHPSTRHKFMVKQCSPATSSYENWCSAPNIDVEAEAAAQLYQQQQYEHQQTSTFQLSAPPPPAQVHHNQQHYHHQQQLEAQHQHQQQQHWAQEFLWLVDCGRAPPSLEFYPDQRVSAMNQCAASCAERRGRTLPSLESCPDQEMSAMEE
ncbi:hypothetical protein T484DRAFT_1910319 [Baffinella frigidus]|nr:hypothetical protein T484DRAFT_1910319 [Cryptophyta sp. CCMP2293]